MTAEATVVALKDKVRIVQDGETLQEIPRQPVKHAEVAETLSYNLGLAVDAIINFDAVDGLDNLEKAMEYINREMTRLAVPPKPAGPDF